MALKALIKQARAIFSVFCTAFLQAAKTIIAASFQASDTNHRGDEAGEKEIKQLLFLKLKLAFKTMFLHIKGPKLQGFPWVSIQIAEVTLKTLVNALNTCFKTTIYLVVPMRLPFCVLTYAVYRELSTTEPIAKLRDNVVW